LHVIGDDGTITTYDADGNVADTIVTPAAAPDTVALDPGGTRLAIGSTDTNDVVIVDLWRGRLRRRDLGARLVPATRRPHLAPLRIQVGGRPCFDRHRCHRRLDDEAAPLAFPP
jgi:hypothetical protein